MITISKISIALAIFTIASLQLKAQNKNTISIEGSGNVITKTVTTQPYNVINVRGSMEVLLENGKEGNIQVTADDNVQDYILVESDGNTLTISMKGNTSLRNTKKIKIKVPFENLSELSLNGSGVIGGKDIIKSDLLKLSLSGSGDMELNIDTNSVLAELNGSGEMELTGNTKDFQIKTTGSGELEGKKLTSENAKISITGSGNSSIFVNNSLTGEIQGSGAVYYGGNPASNTVKVRGSGKVSPM